MSDNARLEFLIARHLDGRMEAAELAELDAALRASPAAARRFAEQARLDGDLRTAHRAAGAADQDVGSITQRIAAAERQAAMRSARRFRPRPRRTRWLLPLAAGLAAAAGVLAWLAVRPAADRAPFAVVGRAAPAGTALAGTVTINGGGSIVLAPGSAAVADGTAAEPVLRLGRGTADCTVAPRPQGRFSIVTPHGSLAVVGTAFTVEVGDGTILAVREGTVEAAAGGDRQAVGPGGVARFGAGAPLRAFLPVLRPVPVAAAADWNNSPGTRVTAVGTGPTGAPALRLDVPAGQVPWASCQWRPGVDWRDADGISLIISGSGSGQRLLLEVMDDGPDRVAGGRDAYERFAVEFSDDAVGWRELRFPFSAFTRRKDLWPGMPDDGFGRERVHGLSLIPVQAPYSCQVERLGLYRAH